MVNQYLSTSGELPAAPAGADRWAAEQLFEEDVRSVLLMMRPHRRERLLGWSEYRTGGANFRVTVAWDHDFEETSDPRMAIPNMAQVLETVLVGSARNGDDLSPHEEFALYRSVAHELVRRIDELENCYT